MKSLFLSIKEELQGINDKIEQTISLNYISGVYNIIGDIDKINSCYDANLYKKTLGVYRV